RFLLAAERGGECPPPEGEAFRREAFARCGGAISRRGRLLLERGNLPVQGRDHARADREACAANPRSLPKVSQLCLRGSQLPRAERLLPAGSGDIARLCRRGEGAKYALRAAQNGVERRRLLVCAVGFHG